VFTITFLVRLGIHYCLLLQIEVTELLDQLASLHDALANGPNEAGANVGKVIRLIRQHHHIVIGAVGEFEDISRRFRELIEFLLEV
jgi:hypothetical protein